MIKLFRSRQFLSFLLAGGIAAAVNFGTRIALSQWFSFSVAVVLAYLAGMLTAFMLAERFVFTRREHSIGRSAILFALVNVLAVAQTWAVSMLLAYFALPALGVQTYREDIAHAVGILVPVFTSYLGHKHWTFR